MARFCMFGGQEGQLRPSDSLHITIFGAADWRRLPAVRHVVARRDRRAGGPPSAGTVFITVFGAIDVVWPTLAEDYLALLDAVRSGAMTLADWDEHFGRTLGDDLLRVHAFTLFGAFDGDAVPSEEKELDDLGVQRHLGHIPESAMNVLMLAIGQRGMNRLAAVRQAVVAALAAAT